MQHRAVNAYLASVLSRQGHTAPSRRSKTARRFPQQSAGHTIPWPILDQKVLTRSSAGRISFEE